MHPQSLPGKAAGFKSMVRSYLPRPKYPLLRGTARVRGQRPVSRYNGAWNARLYSRYGKPGYQGYQPFTGLRGTNTRQGYPSRSRPIITRHRVPMAQPQSMRAATQSRRTLIPGRSYQAGRYSQRDWARRYQPDIRRSRLGAGLQGSLRKYGDFNRRVYRAVKNRNTLLNYQGSGNTDANANDTTSEESARSGSGFGGSVNGIARDSGSGLNALPVKGKNDAITLRNTTAAIGTMTSNTTSTRTANTTVYNNTSTTTTINKNDNNDNNNNNNNNNNDNKNNNKNNNSSIDDNDNNKNNDDDNSNNDDDNNNDNNNDTINDTNNNQSTATTTIINKNYNDNKNKNNDDSDNNKNYDDNDKDKNNDNGKDKNKKNDDNSKDDDNDNNNNTNNNQSTASSQSDDKENTLAEILEDPDSSPGQGSNTNAAPQPSTGHEVALNDKNPPDKHTNSSSRLAESGKVYSSPPTLKKAVVNPLNGSSKEMGNATAYGVDSTAADGTRSSVQVVNNFTQQNPVSRPLKTLPTEQKNQDTTAPEAFETGDSSSGQTSDTRLKSKNPSSDYETAKPDMAGKDVDERGQFKGLGTSEKVTSHGLDASESAAASGRARSKKLGTIERAAFRLAEVKKKLPLTREEKKRKLYKSALYFARLNKKGECRGSGVTLGLDWTEQRLT